MRLKTITAPDMPTALKLVREALGDDAVILSSTTDAATKQLVVKAAVEAAENDDEPGMAPRAFNIAATPKEKLLDNLQHILRYHNIPELLLAKIMQRACKVDFTAVLSLNRISAGKSEEALTKLAMEKLIEAYFRFEPLSLEGGSRVLLVGTPGVGKTLTIAKMAAERSMAGLPVSVITCDHKRAGGVEQLAAFTDILKLELHVATTQGELASLLSAVPQNSPVIIDTAGCNPYDKAEISQLAALINIPKLEPILVMPAGGDALEAVDIAEAFGALNPKRLLVTRADTARRFGGILAAAGARNLAFCNASSTPSILGQFQPMTPGIFAQYLLQYQR